ncbi:MAG: hypothetical protein AVDCRST_MAG89-1987 [uncultured Gemmatimonadetes bacterium]|uniref:Uncharacterized protein n=1 Tax=uncultured Gemmatimonadota bacterium TaxID=203437 RepID=A0A6J4LDL5_9BACT|nr:MAG: hypothetical protein AVDCRST_MAG89-1987 [uncultured Gemmatimonadota bacterium]
MGAGAGFAAEGDSAGPVLSTLVVPPKRRTHSPASAALISPYRPSRILLLLLMLSTESQR